MTRARTIVRGVGVLAGFLCWPVLAYAIAFVLTLAVEAIIGVLGLLIAMLD